MKIYLVGGAVRDQLLNLPIKERDYVVVGAEVADMLALGFRQVGKEFPVFLHPKTNEEYALARVEKKVKPGYKGFTFEVSKDVTLEADLQRRDLTINAMALDLETNVIIDPFHGQHDLKAKRLRHVSPAFGEDPVRILRVGRFLARLSHLGFSVSKDTLKLMEKMVKLGEIDALVPERVWKELDRALAEHSPEKFFELLFACDAAERLFPNLAKEGFGLKSLRIATNLTPKSSIRFAVLLADHPENKKDKTDAREVINELCNRYRVPNAYRELAILTTQNYNAAMKATSLSAEKLLALFNRLDIFRREARFNDFIIACSALAIAKQYFFDPDWLMRCAQVAKSYDIQELLTQGLETNQLAYAIKEKRKEKIELWLIDQK